MSTSRWDVVVVGAGPGGLAAAAHARALGLAAVALERADHLADTIHSYQAGKHVMAEPGLVPLRGELPFEQGSREQLLATWAAAAREDGLDIRLGQEVVGLAALGAGEDARFVVTTSSGESYRAGSVVVALGTQGNPRRLGAPGEDLPHVTTRLIDPAAVRDEDVVVVGAGDSALEIAIALAPENRAHLVVRTSEILRAKESLERAVLRLAAAGQLKIWFSSTVAEVAPKSVRLKTPEGETEVAAGRVFVKIGADPPRRLLERWGVRFSGEGREARPLLSASHESSVPGLYLIGAVAGRDLIKLAINQGYEAVEAIAGRACDPADEEVLCRRLPFWPGKASERIEALRRAIALLGAADPLELREVFLSAEVRRVPAGEIILRQNDYTDSLLLIESGAVEIVVRPETGGGERRLALLGKGEFFGEMGLISGRRRNATAVAREPTCLIEVPRKAMLKLLQGGTAVRQRIDDTFLLRAFQKLLFPSTPIDALRALAARARLERLERDATVFREGESGDAFYFIRSGMVRVSRRSGEREIVAAYLTAGNSFGELALLDGAARTATVTTIFPSELIRLGRADCDAFLAGQPAARADLEANLEPRRIQNLMLDATPRAGELLHDLIAHEVVMGTDALLIDNGKCVRCGNCVAACEGVHADGQARLSLTGVRFENVLVPNSCWQCNDPLCMLDCPPDAIVRNARGEVYIKSNCIGCGNCARNCPYDNIFMVHPKSSRAGGAFGWLKSLLGQTSGASEREVAVKCDLCASLAGGPACVRSCPTGAALRVDPQAYRQTIESVVVRRGEA